MIILSVLSCLTFILGYHKNQLIKIIIYGVLMISITFIDLLSIYKEVYIKYDVGYNVAKYIHDTIPHHQVIDYNLHSLSLEFYLKSQYTYIHNLNNLPVSKSDFYIVTSLSDLLKIKSMYYVKHKNIKIIKYFQGTSIDQVPSIIKGDKSHIMNYVLIKI